MSSKPKSRKKSVNKNVELTDDLRRAIHIEARATTRRLCVMLIIICFIAIISCAFIWYLYATQPPQSPEKLPSISENSSEYLRDRLDDLAESQKWVLLIFGGLAALITLLGASFQWLQYAEVRRDREMKEPAQLEMLHQVNEVIETAQKTLLFRLREEKERHLAQKAYKMIKSNVDVLRAEADDIFEQLKNQLPVLATWPRIAFTALDASQEAFATRFLQRFAILPKWFRNKHQKELDMGQATYFAGVIAFVNNDIVYAVKLLHEAKDCRDTNASITDDQLQYWGAFVTYWIGLIEKNWGKLEHAQELFEDSLRRVGPHGIIVKKDEWLTRLSLAEVMMYGQNSRPEAKELNRTILGELGEFSKDSRDETKKMWTRAKLLAARGEFSDKNFVKAKSLFQEVLDHYEDHYYAAFGKALCQLQATSDGTDTREEFAKTLKLIRASGDLKTKKELGPLAGLTYVAMRAAQLSNEKEAANEFKKQLYDLLDPRKTVFNGYQLRVFVPDEARMILAEELRGSLNKLLN